MDSQQSIKVSLVGFNEKMASSIAYFLDKQQHSPTPFQLTDPTDDQAIILVDGDSMDGQVYLTDTKSASHKILVAKFKAAANQPFPCLMKPVIPNELIKKLVELSSTDLAATSQHRPADYVHDKNHHLLKQALVNNRPNPQRASKQTKVPTDEAQFYQPKQFLHSVLKRCMDQALEAESMTQAHLPFGDWVVDAESRLVYLMIGNKHIRHYERLALTELVMVRNINQKHRNNRFSAPDHVLDYDDLMWDLSMGAACGRLPVATDVDAPFQLKHWPNLTRIRPAKHACQIAAFWSQNCASIRQVIEQLKIDHRAVYGFFSAAKASGLLVPGKQAEQLNPTKETQTKPSMMARLLSHLRHVS